MDHFEYKNGELYAEDVALRHIADEVGSPVYVYSTATLERHYLAFAEGVSELNPLICFAVKANSNIAVIKTLARLGAGADVVSIGELKRAIVAGIPAISDLSISHDIEPIMHNLQFLYWPLEVIWNYTRNSCPIAS